MAGHQNRHTGSTKMNEKSSRSHSIFRITVESREVAYTEDGDRVSIDGAVRVAQLNLVDLAGSERADATGAEGTRLKEGGNINKSLLFLGTVISQLSDGDAQKHIPYRNSRLTRILQNSLGGNARTAIICTVTPASAFAEESLSTLKFASRAKSIRNKAVVNEVVSDDALLKRYRKEINELKAAKDPLKQEKDMLAEEVRRRALQLQEQEQKIEQLQRMICVSSVSVARPADVPEKAEDKKKALRRGTWCPGSFVQFKQSTISPPFFASRCRRNQDGTAAQH